MRAILVLSLSVLSFVLLGEDGPARAQTGKTGGWGADRLDFGEHIAIANDHNFYGLDYAQWKADGKAFPCAQFWLLEPRMHAGFSRPVLDFFKMTVNGIAENRLQPKKEDLKLWEEDGRAGCDIAMNFDGAKLIVRWCMRPGSPLLLGRVRMAPDTLEPAKSVKISFTMMLSDLAKDANGNVRWESAYDRQALSPARLIRQDARPIPLTPADRYLIFQDGKYDGSGEGKGSGPCYLTFDYREVMAANLRMGNCVFTNLDVELKPGFKEFNFGLWQQKNDISNAAFMEKFKGDENAFALSSDVTVADRLNYKITIPANASETVKFAAAELQAFLAKTYQKDIALNGATPGKLDFRVGFPDAALKAEFAVSRRGDSILIRGNDDPGVKPLAAKGKTGTLLGVYYFLRTYAGVKFFAPTEDGFRTSPEFPLVIDKADDVPTPAFEVRGFVLGDFGVGNEEMVKFMKRMLGVIPSWASPDYYYDFTRTWKQRFWETRPGLFAVHGGKRYNGEYPYHFPCLSNPEVLEQVVADVLAAIDKQPEIKVVRFFCDAPYARCECDKCKNSPLSQYLTDTDNSEEIYTFLNNVAIRLHKVHPDLVIATQTKDNYHFPPKSTKLEPNFVVEILAGRAYESNKRDAAAAEAVAWEKAGAKTMLKSYQQAGAPLVTAGLLVDYYRAFEGKTRGDKWSDLGYKTPYSFNALNLYAQMSTLFNTRKNADELIAEFCAAAYPGAEKEMVEFYRCMGEALPQLMIKPIHPDALMKPAELLDAAAAKGGEGFWLKRLRGDFASFRAPVEKNRPATEAYLKKLEEYRNAQESNKSFAIPTKLKFFPLSPYEDFQESEVALAVEDNTLSLRFTAMEKNPGELSARCLGNHHGDMWLDDCFEFMVAPPDKVYPYYQFIVNSKGRYLVLLHEDESSSREMKDVVLAVKAEVRADRWTVDVGLPLGLVNKVAPEGKGRMGIFRTRVLGELHANSNLGRRQSSGIRMSGASYHDVNDYCDFTFGASNTWWPF